MLTQLSPSRLTIDPALIFCCQQTGRNRIIVPS